MNRTDRLYAIVEELRAAAPRPRSAASLAAHFEVSARTVERDISALQQSGTPIYAEPGRRGGYVLDPARTLPPVNFTPAEAVAMATALQRLEGTPFQVTAGTAMRKLVAAMQSDDAVAARELAGRVHLVGRDGADPAPRIPALIAGALTERRVLRIAYADRDGTATTREIEPLGYLGGPDHWYLVAWCRLRAAVRGFRTDRIVSVTATSQLAPARELRPEDLAVAGAGLRRLTLG